MINVPSKRINVTDFIGNVEKDKVNVIQESKRNRTAVACDQNYESKDFETF